MPDNDLEPSRERGAQVFRDNLDLIEEIARTFASQRGLTREDAEDFRQDFIERLIRDDYAVLRNYQGRSSLRAYLGGVAGNAMVEFLASRLGRWRSSTMARSLGPVAVELERLVIFHETPVDEAVRFIQERFGESLQAAELRRIAGMLPVRSRRRLVGEGSLREVSSDLGNPQEAVEAREAGELKARLDELLPRAFATLDAEEIAILKLTLLEENRVSELARSWKRNAQELYRIRRKALARLRAFLIEAGIDPAAVRRLLGLE